MSLYLLRFCSTAAFSQATLAAVRVPLMKRAIERSSGFQFFHHTQQNLLQSIYSKDEQEQILHFINEFESSYITRFKFPSSLQKVLDFRHKNGPVTELNDLLEIKGVSSKPAKILCDAILKKLKTFHNKGTNINEIDETTDVTTTTFSQRKLQKLVRPHLTQSPGKFAAINIMAHSVSWAVLERRKTWRYQNLLNWGFYDLPVMPLRKMNLVNEILSLRKLLPEEDVYVLTNHNSGKVAPNPLKDQLYGIILSILCSKKDFIADAENDLFFLSFGAPGQVFNLNVGSETISAQGVLTDLLLNEDNRKPNAPTSELLERLNELNFHDGCVLSYINQDGFHRESLSKSLILAKTFVEIIRDSFPDV